MNDINERKTKKNKIEYNLPGSRAHPISLFKQKKKQIETKSMA